MNSRMAKQIRKKVRKEGEKLKVMALKDFFEFAHKQPFSRRFRLAMRLLFKKLYNGDEI